MPRTVTSGQATALTASNVALILFVEMTFDAQTLRLCSAGYDITWGGFPWLGVGQMGSIDDVREAEGGEVSGLGFTLSGIPSDLISLALNEPYQGRRVRVYVGFASDTTYALIDTPVLEWEGLIDTMATQDNGETAEIRVTAENELFDFERPNVLLYTDEEQQALFPGDLGLQYVAQQSTRPLIWPAASFFAR